MFHKKKKEEKSPTDKRTSAVGSWLLIFVFLIVSIFLMKSACSGCANMLKAPETAETLRKTETPEEPQIEGKTDTPPADLEAFREVKKPPYERKFKHINLLYSEFDREVATSFPENFRTDSLLDATIIYMMEYYKNINSRY
jgi:hypothetical protein